jgi:hypothetical protein
MTVDVKESGEYENYLDQDARMQDEYRMSLEHLVGVIDTPLADNSGKRKVDPDLWKAIYVHFRSVEDIVDFSKRIGYIVANNLKDFWYPLADPRASLFDDGQVPLVDVDMRLCAPRKDKNLASLEVEVNETEESAWKEHWVGMPEFEYLEDSGPIRSVIVKFRRLEDYEEFSRRIDQVLTDKSKAIWHPKLERTPNYLLRWVEE